MVLTDSTSADRGEVSNDGTSAPVGVIDVYAAIQHLDDGRRQPIESRIAIFPDAYSNTSSSDQCVNEVHLDVSTDLKGGEIYYRLKRLSNGEIIWMTRPDTLDNNSKYSEKSCLEIADDCHRFDTRDKGGDSISDGGGIEISYKGDKLYRGGNFGKGGMLLFGDC